MRDIADDYYDFDEKNFCLIGRRHHNKYSLGDAIRIKVASKPFRAYMVEKSSAPAAGAKMFNIGFDNDGTTAIDSLNTIADDNATYYDLQGKEQQYDIFNIFMKHPAIPNAMKGDMSYLMKGYRNTKGNAKPYIRKYREELPAISAPPPSQ